MLKLTITENPKKEGDTMKDKKKQKIIMSLIIAVVALLVTSFILFFKGYYGASLGVGGVFFVLATALGQWSSTKNEDYVYRKSGGPYL
ncbi:hypothetical protein D1859_17005 [Priestia flexa]|jgi:flagellar basal body-associated protein FliL|nr:hypothetical protein D1859_17005 [Priestia flexa]